MCKPYTRMMTVTPVESRDDDNDDDTLSIRSGYVAQRHPHVTVRRTKAAIGAAVNAALDGSPIDTVVQSSIAPVNEGTSQVRNHIAVHNFFLTIFVLIAHFTSAWVVIHCSFGLILPFLCSLGVFFVLASYTLTFHPRFPFRLVCPHRLRSQCGRTGETAMQRSGLLIWPSCLACQ